MAVPPDHPHCGRQGVRLCLRDEGQPRRCRVPTPGRQALLLEPVRLLWMALWGYCYLVTGRGMPPLIRGNPN